MNDTLRPVVTDNGEKSRFEAEWTASARATPTGWAPDHHADHTVVDPDVGGRGVGSR